MSQQQRVKKLIWKRWWVWVIAGLVVIALIGGCGGNENDLDKEQLEQAVLNALRDSYEGTAEVELDEEAFIIIPTDLTIWPGVLEAIHGDPIVLATWEIIFEKVKYESSIIETDLPGYRVDLRNPNDPTEYSLFLVEDGVVIYSFLDD